MKTEILKWKDGKAGVFYLAFDDSCHSHVDCAIPELEARKLIGTFYINPGTERFASHREAWETSIPKTGMVYANHTFTHIGALSVQAFDNEVQLCQEAIAHLLPNKKSPRLISFARPGVPVENWRITDLQYKEQIATSTDVLDARTELTQAESNYYQALYGYMISLCDLERAMGKRHVQPASE